MLKQNVTLILLLFIMQWKSCGHEKNCTVAHLLTANSQLVILYPGIMINPCWQSRHTNSTFSVLCPVDRIPSQGGNWALLQYLPPLQTQWPISLRQDLFSPSANSAFTSFPTSSVWLGNGRSALCLGLPQCMRLFLTNILSAGVPPDWNHKAILGNLKPMSTISLHQHRYGAPESCN